MQTDLLLGSRAMALGSQARFLCRMEADPAELELSWYLNNSQSERRLLHTGENRNQRSNEHQTNSTTASRLGKASTTTTTTTLTSSQLNYLVESNLDYGLLYCVAKNSIGQQKRACVYQIEQPG